MPNSDHRDGHEHDDGRMRERERVETSAAARRVAAEVSALHVFLVEWFRGQVRDDDDTFAAGFVRRFDPGFVLIGPGGELRPLAQVTRRIRAGHGSNPELEIEIRDVVLRRELAGLVVVTYEEWQRHARHTPTPINARISTALLQPERVAPGGLAWLHLHECWLPG